MKIPTLTARQQEVAQLVAQAYTTKQIAAALGIAERTVHIHIRAVAREIGANAQRDERVQVATWWLSAA